MSDLQAHLIGGPHHGQTLDVPADRATDDSWLMLGDGEVYAFDHAHPGGERFYVYNAPPDQMEDR